MPPQTNKIYVSYKGYKKSMFFFGGGTCFGILHSKKGPLFLWKLQARCHELAKAAFSEAFPLKVLGSLCELLVGSLKNTKKKYKHKF